MLSIIFQNTYDKVMIKSIRELKKHIQKSLEISRRFVYSTFKRKCIPFYRTSGHFLLMKNVFLSWRGCILIYWIVILQQYIAIFSTKLKKITIFCNIVKIFLIKYYNLNSVPISLQFLYCALLKYCCNIIFRAEGKCTAQLQEGYS